MQTDFSRIKIFLISLICIAILILPQNIFSQDKKDNVPDETKSINLVNNYLSVLNSGNKDSMQNFVTHHFDENFLKRFPLFNLVTFCMSTWYQSGGMGYQLVEIFPTRQNVISAELLNKLTNCNVMLRIPVSETSSCKIRGLIETKINTSNPDRNSEKDIGIKNLVAKLDICLKKLEADSEFSGTVIVAKGGKPLVSKAISEANKSWHIPNRIDTKFNLASVGKIFTGLAVVQLAEKGLLTFDDTIDKYISKDWLNPGVSRKIQVKHLLTHTSGLGDYFRKAYNQCEIPYFRELEDYKSLIANDTLLFEPGSGFSYSNTGMLLLGVVIEKVTHEKYFDYLKNNIFLPAGMMNTGGYSKDRPADNLATGYTKLFENGEITWDSHLYTRVMKGSPSGGVYSTAEDLLKFEEALKSGKLVSPGFLNFLLEGKPELNASFHSYGFFTGNGDKGIELSHSGDGSGVNCWFKIYYDAGYTCIVLSNYSPPSAGIVSGVIEQLISKI